MRVRGFSGESVCLDTDPQIVFEGLWFGKEELSKIKNVSNCDLKLHHRGFCLRLQESTFTETAIYLLCKSMREIDSHVCYKNHCGNQFCDSR